MTTLTDVSKKPTAKSGVSVSFRLDDGESKRLNALCSKHSLDKHVYVRNCVMDHISAQEAEDKADDFSNAQSKGK